MNNYVAYDTYYVTEKLQYIFLDMKNTKMTIEKVGKFIDLIQKTEYHKLYIEFINQIANGVLNDIIEIKGVAIKLSFINKNIKYTKWYA